jgi:hypothetical protein
LRFFAMVVAHTQQFALTGEHSKGRSGLLLRKSAARYAPSNVTPMEKCEEATGLLVAYTTALSAFHEAQAPLLTRKTPVDVDC